MILNNNTILITGGSSGIGLELAKRLIDQQNKVIICSRSQEKLGKAKNKIPEVITIPCDISDTEECKKLASIIKQNYPECNVLINNAAIVHRTNFNKDEQMVEKAEKEIQTNLMAPIRLTKYFLSILDKNPNPVLINITTGLVYAPKVAYPIYNATKAALHSFTQMLRAQMKNSTIDIIEVLFPVVDTPWHEGNAPKMAITAREAVSEMIHKLEKGQKEIRIGKVKLLYWLSRIAPSIAIKIINRT